MWRWRKAEARSVACPGCKREDRFVLVAQFHSIGTDLKARVESIRVACEHCHGQWDLSRSGAAVEVRPARQEPAARPAENADAQAEPIDTDLRGLYAKGRR